MTPINQLIKINMKIIGGIVGNIFKSLIHGTNLFLNQSINKNTDMAVYG